MLNTNTCLPLEATGGPAAAARQNQTADRGERNGGRPDGLWAESTRQSRTERGIRRGRWRRPHGWCGTTGTMRTPITTLYVGVHNRFTGGSNSMLADRLDATAHWFFNPPPSDRETDPQTWPNWQWDRNPLSSFHNTFYVRVKLLYLTPFMEGQLFYHKGHFHGFLCSRHIVDDLKVAINLMFYSSSVHHKTYCWVCTLLDHVRKPQLTISGW